jgi:hypothetical protein
MLWTNTCNLFHTKQSQNKCLILLESSVHSNCLCDKWVFLQILKWEPDYYKTISDLPQGMPESLQNHIKEVEKNDSAMVSLHFIHYTFIKSIQGSANLLVTKFVTKSTEINNIRAISTHMSRCQKIHKYNMRKVYNQLKINTVISQYIKYWTINPIILYSQF